MTTPPPRDRIEALLEADPRIEGFALRDEGGGLRVTATGAADWFVEQRRVARQAISGRILRQWQFVYDRSYRSAGEVRAPNFDVWVSGFTNAPIPLDQMRAWLDDVLRQLRGVRHGRVLDIGCGSGLVLAELAPGGVSYDAIDLSSEAIGALGAWAAGEPALAHVRLAHGGAHEIGGRGGETVDLAVLNSVVQYFPEADYLLDVLAAVQGQVAADGAIFLGDLRASALLPMRAINVAVAQSAPEATAEAVRAKARLILERTGELAVDPRFFQGLGAAIGRPCRARLALKPGGIDHDLAGYRYDALLTLDAAEAPAAPVLHVRSLAEIAQAVDGGHLPALAVMSLPNARLARDAALAEAMRAAPADATVAAVLAGLEAETAAVEPTALLDLAKARGYQAELRFTPGASDGRFDALLIRDGEAADWPEGPTEGPLANDPLGAELAAGVRRDLLKALQAAAEGRPIALEFTPPPP